jgi:hypothetical protein
MKNDVVTVTICIVKTKCSQLSPIFITFFALWIRLQMKKIENRKEKSYFNKLKDVKNVIICEQGKRQRKGNLLLIIVQLR